MMTYRAMVSGDVAACLAITKLNWGDNVARRTEVELIDRGEAEYLIAWDGSRVAGFAGMRPCWSMFGVWEFVWINVHPDYQKKSIGTDLTHLRISEVKRRGGALITLFTREHRFFEKFGFKPVGAYSDTQERSWVQMNLSLGPLPFDAASE